MAIIYLHIGLHKTATTSIQRCLRGSVKTLAKSNVLIPQTGQAMGSCHQLAWCFLPNCPAWYPLSRLSAESLYKQLNAEIDKAGAGKVIISSEDFSLVDKDDSTNPQHIKKLKTYLGKHKVRIIVYLRSQVDYLASFYNQTHKAFDTRFPDKTIDGLCKALPGILDYEVLIGRWASVFGEENMSIGLFEECRKVKGIVEDFADKCGIALHDAEQAATNPGLDDDALAYRLLVNDYPFDEYAKAVLANPLAAVSCGKYNLPFSEEFALELGEKYSLSNERLIKHYFGREHLNKYIEFLSKQSIKSSGLSTLTWEKASQITGALIGETVKELSILEERSYKRHFDLSTRQGEMDKKLELISENQALTGEQMVNGFEQINERGERYKRQLNHLVLNIFSKSAKSVSLSEKLAALFRNDARMLEASGLFDKDYYLRVYSDIKAAGTDPVKHYLKYGAIEGRDPSATFSTVGYLSENPDVALSGMNPLVHYICYGKNENRKDGADTCNGLPADSAENSTGNNNGGNNLHLVVIEHDIPKYDTNAGARHTYHYIKLLVDMGMKITLLPFISTEEGVSKEEKALVDIGVNVLKHDSIENKSWSAELWKPWLYDNRNNIDIVVIHRPHVAEVYMDYCKYELCKPVWYMCHDLYFLRIGRQAIVERNENLLVQQAEMMARERAFFNTADVSFTPSEVDKEYLRSKFDISNIVTLPLYIYDDFEDTPREFVATKNIIFVGSFIHAPNIDGIRWFIKEIWPSVLEKEPDTVLDVVGKSPPEELTGNKPENVLLHGYVSDEKLEKLYKEAKAMIVPLRYGAGVKGKVVEAMRSGLPLISTSCGIEGVQGLEQYIHPQDTACGFADEIVRVLNLDENEDEWLSSSLQQLAGSLFTTEIAASLLHPYLKREFYTSSQSRSSTIGRNSSQAQRAKG